MDWPHDPKEANAKLLSVVEAAARTGMGALLRFVQLRTTPADDWRLAFGRIDVGRPDLAPSTEQELKLARSRVEVISATELLERLRAALDGLPFPCRDLELDAEPLASLRNPYAFRSDEADYAEGWPGFVLASAELSSRFPEPRGAFIAPDGHSWNSADDIIRDASGFARSRGPSRGAYDGRLRRVNLIVRDHRARIVSVTFNQDRCGVWVELDGEKLDECHAEVAIQPPKSDWVPCSTKPAATAVEFPLDPLTDYVRVRVIDDPEVVDVRIVSDPSAEPLAYDRFEDIDPGLGVLGSGARGADGYDETPLVASMVHPIHFEDFSGKQFERLVFAFHLRTSCANTLEWYGQVGSDLGRDILGVEEVGDGSPGRSICIQCVNRAKLTERKGRRDLNAAARAVEKNSREKLGVFRLVCRSNVSAKMRDKLKSHARVLGIGSCDVWSGAEFEERLRAKAEPLLKRFVQGIEFPDTAEELRVLVRAPSGEPTAPNSSPPPTVEDVLQRFAKEQADRRAADLADADAAQRVVDRFESELAALILAFDTALQEAAATTEGVDVTDRTTTTLNARVRDINVHVRADRGLYEDNPNVLWIFSQLGNPPSKTRELSNQRMELRVVEDRLLWDGEMTNEALVAWALGQLLSHATKGST